MWKKLSILGICLGVFCLIMWKLYVTTENGSDNKAVGVSEQQVVEKKAEKQQSTIDYNNQERNQERQSDNNNQNEFVDNYVNDVRIFVNSLLIPTEAELKRFREMPRYGEDGFEKMIRELLQQMIGNSIDEKIVQAISDSGLRDAYRFNQLRRLYGSGDINKKFFREATGISAQICDEEHQRILTDDQYEKYFGYSKGESQEMIVASTILPDDEIFLIFPEIKRNNPEIETLDDLRKILDDEIITDLFVISEARDRFFIQTNDKVSDGEISIEEAIAEQEQYMSEFNSYLSSTLSEDQYLLFIEQDYSTLIQNEKKIQTDNPQELLQCLEVDDPSLQIATIERMLEIDSDNETLEFADAILEIISKSNNQSVREQSLLYFQNNLDHDPGYVIDVLSSVVLVENISKEDFQKIVDILREVNEQCNVLDCNNLARNIESHDFFPKLLVDNQKMITRLM